MRNNPQRYLSMAKLTFIAMATWVCTHTMPSSFLAAERIVSDATIEKQKSLTRILKLSNGIPVIVRQVSDSDLVQVSVNFNGGLRQLPAGEKILNRWLWATVPMAASGYPKAKVYKLQERYSLDLGCSGAIELSRCSLGTVNDYWDVALPLFAALVTRPSLTPTDSELQKQRLVAALKSQTEEPSHYVNEVVNRVYYPKGHPYRLTHSEGLEELKGLSHSHLRQAHRRLINANLMSIVVVGSLDEKKIIEDLNGTFGKVKARPLAEPVIVASPSFDKSKALSFEHRKIGTAYIRAKFPAPAIHSRDAAASTLMFAVLKENLWEEVRTKLSLSYSVWATTIQYSIGIGMINASTSRPQETLQAISRVINQMKQHTYSVPELDEYKRVFATNYYQTQETHESLANAIANYYHDFKSVDPLYDWPKRLDEVTPEDVKRLAQEVLTDLRLGIIYDEAKFSKKWAENFIEAHWKTDP